MTTDPARGSTVLVVDDDPVTRQLVVVGLEPLGCREVLEAGDGLAAQEILARRDVDLVITDVIMPRLDGPGLMRWAKVNRPGPVWIILSGVDTFDMAVDAIHLGAFDFLAKPVRAQQLQVAVRNALDHRALVGERERLNEELRQKVVELEDACRLLEDQRDIIHKDLQRAEAIQRALLPAAPSIRGGYCVDALYRTGHHVGGDLYDVECLDDRFVVLYVADAAGHGVSAAMLSVLFKQRLRVVDDRSRPLAPATALEVVNRALAEDLAAPGLFLTAVYGLLDTHDDEIVIAAAGHPPVVLARSDGSWSSLTRTGPALGLRPEASYTEHRIRLRADDRLLFYTDGLLDAPQGAALDPQRLAEIIGAVATTHPGHGSLHDLFRSSGAEGAEGDQDDVTLLLLQGHDGPSTFDNGEARRSAMARAGNCPPVPTKGAVLWGEADDRTYLCVRGRGTWTLCDAFHEASCACLEAGRALTLDLSTCDYLDSTFLGTVHEIVSSSEPRHTDVQIQGLRQPVRDMFEELSMTEVLEHVRVERSALPEELHPLGCGSERSGTRRVLRAHETLAALSASNRERFEGVVEFLRREQREG